RFSVWCVPPKTDKVTFLRKATISAKHLEKMVFKENTQDNELYVYMNGKLIYKKWLDTGKSKVFDSIAYDKYTLASIKDKANEQA
ncbi:MAG: hypothetical protein AAFX53_19185, partial [Bacteroidota bacterium]